MKMRGSVLIFISITQFGLSFIQENVKSTEWVVSDSKQTSRPYKFENFDRQGHKEYDSTIFISGMGYEVRRYDDGRLKVAITKIGNSIFESRSYYYDAKGNTIRSTTETKSSKSELWYSNKYDRAENVIEIRMSTKNDTNTIALVKRFFTDSRLDSEQYFVNHLILPHKSVKRVYDSSNRLKCVIEKDLGRQVTDSTVITTSKSQTTKFRKNGYSKFIVFFDEIVIQSDSSVIQITTAIEGKHLIKRTKVVYW